MNKKNENKDEEQKTLRSVIHELKKCDAYSRASKFYDKTIKTKKITNIMKAMGLIKINEFSEVQLLNKEKKKKNHIPFSIKKVKDYLLKKEQEERQKEIIKKEKFNNTIAKKLHKMTELSIQEHNRKYSYLPPDIGTYNPKYDSIYKKTKATIISGINKDSKENIIKNKSDLNIAKTLSFNNLNNNSKLYSTIEAKNRNCFVLTEKNEDNKNKRIFPYNNKFENKYPLINKNKNFIKFNTLATKPTSTFTMKNIFKSKIKKNILINNAFENDKNNNSISFNKDKSKISSNQYNSSKKLFEKSDIFCKTKAYNNSYFKNKKKTKMKTIKSRNDNLTNSKKNLSLKTILLKPSIPSIGYYNPKYDYIKSSLPKISFLYHNNNNQKDNFSFKKNLLRKIIIKYNINTDYEVITDLNNKK